MSIRSLALAVLAVVLACSGCGSSASATPTPKAFLIRTAAVPAQSCMAALITGQLTRNAASGLGLSHGPAGPPTVVEWPFGYSARDEGGRIALLDQRGVVVAREADFVQMAGGIGEHEIWYACGPVELTGTP